MALYNPSNLDDLINEQWGQWERRLGGGMRNGNPQGWLCGLYKKFVDDFDVSNEYDTTVYTFRFRCHNRIDVHRVDIRELRFAKNSEALLRERIRPFQRDAEILAASDIRPSNDYWMQDKMDAIARNMGIPRSYLDKPEPEKPKPLIHPAAAPRVISLED